MAHLGDHRRPIFEQDPIIRRQTVERHGVMDFSRSMWALVTAMVGRMK